jgi:type II secretory pathway pseudopilin PulG
VNRQARHHGFLLHDSLAALAIVSVLTIVLAVGLGQWRRGRAALADTQQAAAIAQRVLVSLQMGQTPPGEDEATRIMLRPLEGGTGPLAGWHWARVSVVYRQREAEVIGIVPSALVRRESK